MPEEEFNSIHRFKPYFLLGQLDYSKEVLIPKKNPVSGEDGFDVINPLYCYEGGRISWKMALSKDFKDDENSKLDPILTDRAGIIVNRGWIPARLADKKKRP
jgi:cytochrome oxidase assembly protein ShyY1